MGGRGGGVGGGQRRRRRVRSAPPTSRPWQEFQSPRCRWTLEPPRCRSEGGGGARRSSQPPPATRASIRSGKRVSRVPRSSSTLQKPR